MNKILIIAPHPDDDVIGVGGTIFKLYNEKHKIDIIYVTSGTGSKKLGPYKDMSNKEFANLRKTEAINSIKKLCGTKHKIKQKFLKFESNYLKNDRQNLVAELKKIINHNIIYIPYLNDLHSTHNVVSKATLEAIKAKNINTTIFEYEVWTPIPINAKTIVEDISSCIKIKQNAIKEHKSQLLILDFDEGILGKNRYNAVFSRINNKTKAKYAEIFRKTEFCKK